MKKAMAFEHVMVMVVIGIASLLVLLLVINKINSGMDESTRIKNCQNSIDAYVRLRKMSLGTALPELNCPTQYTTITTEDEEKIKEEIIDKIAKCWNMWKKGEYKFMGQSGKPGYTTQYCHVCEVFDFKNKNIRISSEEMKQLWEERRIGSKSLLDYFYPVFNPSLDEISETNPQNIELQRDFWTDYMTRDIDTSKTYAILYNELALRLINDKIHPIQLGEEVKAPVFLSYDHLERKFVSVYIYTQVEHLNLIFPLLVEYDAEELKYCQMTIAGQKT